MQRIIRKENLEYMRYFWISEKLLIWSINGILLRKLAELNVNKSFWMWTKSFLEGRRQQVKLGDTKSRTVICRAGVPQGSVISPHAV